MLHGVLPAGGLCLLLLLLLLPWNQVLVPQRPSRQRGWAGLLLLLLLLPHHLY